LAPDARPALLGAQNRQRPQQTAEQPATESQAGAAGNLDGRDQDGCACRLRRLRQDLGRQIRQGGRVPDQGPRRAARLLRLPAEHWKHLRTTNVIESSFATVRHRTVRSKGCLSNKTALAMIFKLAEAVEKRWRRLNGHNQLPKIILGIKFTDGIEVVRSQAQTAAA